MPHARVAASTSTPPAAVMVRAGHRHLSRDCTQLEHWLLTSQHDSAALMVALRALMRDWQRAATCEEHLLHATAAAQVDEHIQSHRAGTMAIAALINAVDQDGCTTRTRTRVQRLIETIAEHNHHANVALIIHLVDDQDAIAV